MRSDPPSDRDVTLDDVIDVATVKSHRHLTLLVLSGPAAGQWFLVPAGGAIVGRHPDCDVMVADPAISRRQAKLVQRDDGSHWLEDLGSRNGTYLGERRVSEPVPLEDGVQIQLSSASVLRARYLGAQETLLLHQLQEAATTDPLTGVANRRYLLLRLSQELSYAKRHKAPVSLLMADLDNFKTLNDREGHPAGDMVLREIAHVIESAARLEDVVARYGGDEFVIVARGLTSASALRFGQRLCRAVQEAAFDADIDEPIALSIGVAAYDPALPDRDGSLDMMGLIARADAAVYRAKDLGKNRAAAWAGEPVGPADGVKPTQRNPRITLDELPQIDE